MKTIIINEPINLRVVKYELNFDLSNTSDTNKETKAKKPKEIRIPKIEQKKQHKIPAPPPIKSSQQKPDVKELVEKLLDELYTDQREWSRNSVVGYSQSLTTAASVASSHSNCDDQTDVIERIYLEDLGKEELQDQLDELMNRFSAAGERLAKYLRARDRLKREQKKLCAAFTVLLRHISTLYFVFGYFFSDIVNLKPNSDIA